MLSHNSLLPPNATALERATEAAITPDMGVPIDTLWNPATCPASLLPWLAWALHVTDGEGWSLAETDAQKRALIVHSIELHRKKGTVWSVIEALRSIGFGDSEIVEHLPQIRYDGSLAYSGGEQYAAFGWAQFRLVADLSEERPLRADEVARIVAVVDEWKPLHTELVDVQFKATVSDAVTSSEATAVAAELAQEDSHLWGRRMYDGSIAFDHGLLRSYDGAFAFGGAADHSGFTAAGERFDAEREADDMAGVLALSDVQSRGPLFDGYGNYGGALDFGASAPVAEDLPMPIVMTRHRRYDGRHSFAANRFDGGQAYAGSFTYVGNIPYAGDVVTALEVL